MQLSYLHLEADDSWCCSGYQVEYWWVGTTPVSPPAAIDHILDLIERELTADSSRYWSERRLDDELGRLEGLLIRASQGRLLAVGEIKALERPQPRRMFELRADVGTERVVRMAGRVISRESMDEPLRIYHGEPKELAMHALGLHLHVKAIEGDIEAQQNREIDIAIERLDAGESARWGLPH